MLIDSEDHHLHFSAASVWEVAIKTSLGRPDFSVDADELRRGLLRSGFSEVPISGQHAQAVATLPMMHRDPFDRLLIVQARSEGLLLLTADRKVAEYGSGVRLV